MADMEIGYFGDERLRKNGALFAQRVSERQDVCIRGLTDNRSEQVRLRRFLHNEAVTVEEMVAHGAMLTARAASGRHVLAIQDTSEINYQAQSGRKQRLGTVGNGSDVGLFIHPVLAVDAEDGECLGLVDAQVWRRTKGKAKDYRRLPIEEKESYRWLRGGDQAKAVLGEAAMVTVLDDREGDIYEKWARLPDARTLATLAGLPEAHRYEFELVARPGKRSARTAVMAVRFAPVRIRRPLHCSDAAAPAEIELYAIEVRELDPPAGEEPVLWRLLTTHRVESVAQAVTAIGWYRLRWHIEQLFRTLKRQGLRIEQSVIEDGAALEKLAVIGLIGAAITMQLVMARAAPERRPPASGDETAAAMPPAGRVFDEAQVEVLHVPQRKLQGRTLKQQNLHPTGTLAWAGWTIARLGGWTGYASDKSAGPITMRDGLQRFNAIVQGYHLARNVCPS